MQGGIAPKAKERTPVSQLINITKILTNGRPASQTVQPLGHKAGVCPGALRTLSGLDTSAIHISLCSSGPHLSRQPAEPGLAQLPELHTEDLFFKTDLHGRMYLNSQTLEFDGKQQKVRGKKRGGQGRAHPWGCLQGPSRQGPRRKSLSLTQQGLGRGVSDSGFRLLHTRWVQSSLPDRHSCRLSQRTQRFTLILWRFAPARLTCSPG